MAIIDDTKPKGVDPEFAALVERYATALEEGRIADAQVASNAVMAAAFKDAQENPSPEFLRSLIAGKAENDGEWEVAERIFQEDLDDASKHLDPAIRGCCQTHPLLDLARIARWQEKYEQAYELARQAVKSARLRDWEFHTAWALAAFSSHALRAGRREESLTAANEGLRLLGCSSTHYVQRANLFLLQAEAHFDFGDLAKCQQAIDSAWQTIEPLSSMNDAAGVQSTIAHWWRLVAKLRTTQGEWPRAREAWESSVALHRYVADVWDRAERRCNFALSKALGEFAVASEAAGERQRAVELKAEQESVLLRNPKTSNAFR